MRRRLPLTIAAVAVALLGAGAPSAAQAAPEPLLVSVDGSTWSSSISSGLFSGDLRVIPGGEYSRTFWVTSNVDGALDLTVDVCDVTSSDAAFAASVSLASTSAASAVGTPVALDRVASGDCSLILPAESLRKGQQLPVLVTMRMAADSPNAAADASLGFVLRVMLSESTDAPDGGATSPSTPSTALPGSGTSAASTPGRAGSRATTSDTSYATTVAGGGLGQVDTRAFPPESDASNYSEDESAAGSRFIEVALQPVTIGGLAILIGILAALMLLFVGRGTYRIREEGVTDDDER